MIFVVIVVLKGFCMFCQLEVFLDKFRQSLSRRKGTYRIFVSLILESSSKQRVYWGPSCAADGVSHVLF